MPDETLFEFEQTMSRAEVARYLRSVAEHLESDGTINFSAGARQSTVDVPSRVDFEVEVERETSDADAEPVEMSIELEIEWIEGKENASLDIS